jgi:hypothetical protein
VIDNARRHASTRLRLGVCGCLPGWLSGSGVAPPAAGLAPGRAPPRRTSEADSEPRGGVQAESGTMTLGIPRTGLSDTQIGREDGPRKTKERDSLTLTSAGSNRSRIHNLKNRTRPD